MNKPDSLNESKNEASEGNRINILGTLWNMFGIMQEKIFVKQWLLYIII